ncbi:hypothetical protein J1605_004939 [Eschrichtius robustus]|uniref:Uncharacterized protein n=1 Tax=Eschrichtius robustus TaxID=9764 RepID=A0AB34HAJ8_ESCRO|nr:hypothetical protein J1605_004939 [Eschrichtius robustus]
MGLATPVLEWLSSALGSMGNGEKAEGRNVTEERGRRGEQGVRPGSEQSGTVPAMGARHECNVALDGFWWTVVYQRDENRCWGTMQEVRHYVGTKLKVEGVSRGTGYNAGSKKF